MFQCICRGKHLHGKKMSDILFHEFRNTQIVNILSGRVRERERETPQALVGSGRDRTLLVLASRNRHRGGVVTLLAPEQVVLPTPQQTLRSCDGTAYVKNRK